MADYKKEALNCFNVAEKSNEEAKRLIESHKYPEAVDKFYDLVENSIKTLLNLYEIDYPPTHKITELVPQIIEKIPKDNPNFFLYSEHTLPPFISIHSMLKNIRNMVRYGYKGISSGKIISEGVAKSIQLMIDYHYPSLQMWITELLYSPIKRNSNSGIKS